MAEQQLMPIAIVGLGCRLPGGANNPEELWEMLVEGRSAWSDVPSDRWNWKSFYHPSREFSGAHNQRGGHFLDQDIAAFDASFFGIPPTEANSIDPQQRIQVETAYEALENAGMSLDSIRGSRTSVFTAVFSHDYDRFVYKDVSNIPQYHTTGSGDAITSNRISYLFDLKGPSMTIDTGCSGSLVALHQACQSLRCGESDMALVGGTNLILGPDQMIAMSMISLLNDDGKSYAFDSRGSGYGRGEGVATIVLKRLDDAIRDSDPVRAIVRNTGINQDGRTSGITFPNQKSQETLIRSVYEAAGLDPQRTTYVEAHGTGTVAGDFAELQAIANVFCNDGNRTEYLRVGSIKSNIGHLESSSGIAGLIKTVLALERGHIPPNINLETIRKGLDLEEWKIKVPRSLELWPESGARRASLNSFGYGGTNAHAILDASSNECDLSPSIRTKVSMRSRNPDSKSGLDTSLPASVPPISIGDITESASKSSTSPQIFVLTARSESSLIQSVSNLKKWLTSAEEDGIPLSDLAYTLSSRRSLMQWRTSVTAATYQDLSSLLDRNLLINRVAAEIRVCFVFTGQGAQWHAMGRDLIFTHSAFYRSLSKADEILKSLGSPWSLIEELVQNEAQSRVNQSDIAQPTTTAIQIALVDMLESLGITPAAVVGHSSGEIAAGYASGVLTQEMALRISFHRGFIANAVKQIVNGKGAMLAVGLGEEDIHPYISMVNQGSVNLACVNSPLSITISGDEEGIIELQKILQNADVFNRRLKVDTAYHSHHMQKVADQYLAALDGVEAGVPNETVKFFSSVSGEEKASGFGPSYWVANLVSQVKFSHALEKLSACQSPNTKKTSTSRPLMLIEVGPHSALAGPIRQTMAAGADAVTNYTYIPCLLRDRSAKNTILDVVGKLFNQGYPVNLEAANSFDDLPRAPRVITDLPPYPWDHSTSYWHESRLSKEYRLRQHPHHDLLGARVTASTSIEPIWRHVLSASELPWLQEHVIDGSPIFPGSAYICMAIEALRQIIQDRGITDIVQKFVLKEVSWIKPLVIPEAPTKFEIQMSFRSPKTVMDHNTSLTEEFQVTSLDPSGVWNQHCRGTILAEYMPPGDDNEALNEQKLTDIAYAEKYKSIKSSCHHQLDSGELYNQVRSNGNSYGPNFATISDFCIGPNQALGKVTIPDVGASMPAGFHQPHVLHPATLDTLVHSVLPLFYQQHAPSSVMPVSMREISISADMIREPGQILSFGTTLTSTGTRSSSAEIMVFYQYLRAEQNPVMVMSGVEYLGIGETTIPESPFNRGLSYQVEWKSDADLIPAKLLNSSNFVADTQGMTPEGKLGVLNRAASVYIDRCLQIVTDESKVATKHHIHWWKWLKKFHNSDKGKSYVDALTEYEANEVLETAKLAGIEGAVLSRVGPNLASVLTGKIDSVQFMFQDDMMSRFYALDDSMLQCYDRMNEYLDFLTFKTPNLAILEVGAGTGGATLALLRKIRSSHGSLPLERFDYTDVSSGFFAEARELLSEWADVLNFKTLDINHDPGEQGFTKGSYDLIVASNVLHATSSIHTSLTNVRSLLKPGGRLLLIEVTKLTPFYNTCFGIFEGWFAGVHDGRADSPLMSVDQWDSALTKADFSGISVTAHDYEGGAHRSSMMVARASGNSDELPVVEIISEGRSPLATRLSSRFDELNVRSSVTTWHSDPVSKEVIYIILDDGKTPVLSEPSTARFGQIVNLVTQGTRVLWISVSHTNYTALDPMNELVTGFARAVRSENEQLKFVTLNTNGSEDFVVLVERVLEILLQVFGTDPKADLEYRYIGGEVLLPRLVQDKAINARTAATAGKAPVVLDNFVREGRPLRLQFERSGIFNGLTFVDDVDAQRELKKHEIEISVKAWGVNPEEVAIATGQIKGDASLMGECAGIITAIGADFKSSFRIGDRVCAWNGTPFASHARVGGFNAYRLPHDVSFAEGASIPIGFVTAYYGLICLAQLREHQRILIHDASGAIGQAAVTIARRFNAEIFATAENAQKRELLVKVMHIPESHVYSSKTATFKKAILRLTNGAGVDVILNSPLAVDLLHETWACVASFGTLIEIGRVDTAIRPFTKNVTLASVDMMAMSVAQPERAGRIFQSAMTMFDAEAPPAIQPVTAMSMSVIEDAFRLVQSRKYTGKVVLEADASTLVKVVSGKPAELELPRGSSYIVAGGLGYVGRNICRFMASHGATNIIIPSRRSVNLNDHKAFAAELQELGAHLCLLEADINDSAQIQEFVDYCRVQFPPIKGVVHAAVSYQDRPIERMTAEEFKTALEPKVNGTLNLSNALSIIDLDFFLMVSSVVAILGNKAQANYAAGNTFQDAFAKSKAGSKTHYFSLNLGLMDGGSNVVAQQNLVRQGCIPLEMEHLYISLTYAMSGQARSDNCNQLVLGFDHLSISSQEDNVVLKNPLFNLLPRDEDRKDSTEVAAGSQTAEEMITTAATADEVHEIISKAIAKRISALVALSVDDLDLESPLTDFGLDSLIAIDLRNWVTRTFHAVLQTGEIFDSPSTLALAELVCERSEFVIGRFS